MALRLDIRMFECVPVFDDDKPIAVDIKLENSQINVTLDAVVIEELVRVWVKAGGELDLQGILDKKG